MKVRYMTFVYIIILYVFIGLVGIYLNRHKLRERFTKNSGEMDMTHHTCETHSLYSLCLDIIIPSQDHGTLQKSLAYSKNNDINIYAAYYDIRTVVTNRSVRIITIISDKILRDLQNTKMFCHLWFEKMNHPVSVPANFETLKTEGLSHYFAMFSCSIPSKIELHYINEILYDAIPEDVALVQNRCGTYGRLVTVQNKQCIKKKGKSICRKKTDNIAVCASLLHGVVDPVRLVEWVELNRIIGVHQIYIYNASIQGTVNKVLHQYQSRGMIKVKDYSHIRQLVEGWSHGNYPTNDSALNSELEALSLNDCFYSADERFILNIYIDEFLQPPQHLTIKQLIDEEFKQEEQIAMIRFQTAFFSDEFKMDMTSNAPEYLHTMRYRIRTRIDYDIIRSIVDFQNCQITDETMCQKQLTISYRDIPPNLAYIRKYPKKCSIPGKPEKCAELLKKTYVDTELEAYKLKLVEQVLKVAK